ncbi:MAG: hypothetical protein EHM45_05890 [Desulfobacteraceae bacterium]|nr:MAG: hypothetical protein EHM45_05890 [Desulfobacteraceae bacterium]
MESNPFGLVRTSCQAVAEQSSHVKIDHARLAAYARELPLAQIQAPELDPGTHYLGHGEGTAAFFVTLDAINFGSGYFPHLKKRPGLSGYFTVASSLNDYYKEHGPLAAAQLAGLSAVDCARIFGQSPENTPVMELMGLFSKALNDLGAYLTRQFEGRFGALIQAADGSAEALVEILKQMPFFNDVEQYKGRDVHFFKRAQLTAADLAIAFNGQGLGQFRDLHELTIFAENLVPHVLRIDKVLVYEESLAARIDAETLILSGSEEEIEIRACAVHAVELLTRAFRKAGQNIRAMDLDYLLWNRGQEPHYKKIKPRHRTRTVFY